MPRGNGQGMRQQPVPIGPMFPHVPMQQQPQQARRRAPQKQMPPGQQMHPQVPGMPEMAWIKYLASQCETTPEQNQGLAMFAQELRVNGRAWFDQRVPLVFDKIQIPEQCFVFVATGGPLMAKLPGKADPKAQYIGSFKFKTQEEALLDVMIEGKPVKPMDFGERGMSYFYFCEARERISIQFGTRMGSPGLSKGSLGWFIIHRVSPKPPEGVLADLCKESGRYEVPKEKMASVDARTPQCHHRPFNALEVFKTLQMKGTAVCPMCNAPICLQELVMSLERKRSEEMDTQKKERDAAMKKMYETMCLSVRLMTQEPNWGNVVFGDVPATSGGVSEPFEYESTDDYLRQIEHFYS